MEMTTIILTVALQYIVVITIIMHSWKKKCALYTCTFFFRHINWFAKWIRSGRVSRKGKLYAGIRQPICWWCLLLRVRWDAISGSHSPAWFRWHHVGLYREYSLTSMGVKRRWILRISGSTGVAWLIKHSPARQLRFITITITVSLKHSQSSWYTHTALTWQNYLRSCARLVLYRFLTQTCDEKKCHKVAG